MADAKSGGKWLVGIIVAGVVVVVAVVVAAVLVGTFTVGEETQPASAGAGDSGGEAPDLVRKSIAVTDANFQREVLESDAPVLVDFWAPWCPPCRMVAPVLEKLAGEYDGRLKVCKLNVDEGRQTAGTYKIESIPTLKIFKGGKVVDEMVGLSRTYEADLKKMIESHL